MASPGNSTIAEGVAASGVLVQVRNALSGNEVASIKIPLTSCVYDLQLRLEESTSVPVEHQILLREGGVLPLQQNATLLDEGLVHDSLVLFTNQEPEDAALELFEVCQGCQCGFKELFQVAREFVPLEKKTCNCERLPDKGPRMTQIQYLLRYIPDDVPFLQAVFERLVLEGGPRCYTLAAAHLAQDTRINVNGRYGGVSLFECALVSNNIDMLLMLLDTGRLEPSFSKMRMHLYEDKNYRYASTQCEYDVDSDQEEDKQQPYYIDESPGRQFFWKQLPFDELFWKFLGAHFDFDDRESLLSHLVDHLETRTWEFGWDFYVGDLPVQGKFCIRDIFQVIIQQNRQDNPFFKNLTVTYRKAIEDVYKDFLDSFMEWKTSPAKGKGKLVEEKLFKEIMARMVVSEIEPGELVRLRVLAGKWKGQYVAQVLGTKRKGIRIYYVDNDFVQTIPWRRLGLKYSMEPLSAGSSTLVATSSKFNAGGNQSAHSAVPNAHKLDENTEAFRHATFSHEFTLALQQARLAKKMTQAQLATAINEKGSVINEYEAGKAIPNGAIINKLNRSLGVHLPKAK